MTPAQILRISFAAAALAIAAHARQEGAAPKPELPRLPELGGANDPRQEMIELFRKVETRLGEIDKLLYDASAGERGLSGSSLDSGMAELLKTSKGKSEEVLAGIDRILEIAQQEGGTCSSGMSGKSSQKKSQGSNPSQSSQGSGNQPQQGSQGQQQQREATPERPGGQQPAPGEKDGPGQDEKQQQGQGGQPQGNQRSNAEPQNTVGGPPPGLETGRVDPSRDAERWGELPEQYRELFRTEGGGDLPPQYRDWIDAYHRRLNRRR